MKLDTPRTNAVIRARWQAHSCDEVPAAFARELERENARLREAIESPSFRELAERFGLKQLSEASYRINVSVAARRRRRVSA